MLWQQKTWHRFPQLSIRLTGLLIILCSLVVSLPIQAQKEQSQYAIEKKLPDEAIEKKSVDAHNQFVSTYPETVWMERAIYYRDEVALNDAKATGSVESIDRFIQQYPNSVWLDSAVYARDKTAYDLAKKANSKVAYESFIKKYPNSRWLDKVKHKLVIINKSMASSRAKIKPDIKRQKNNSVNQPTLPQKRVSRALQIYSEIDKKRQLKKKEKLRKEAIASEIKLTCHHLKDRLKRHGELVIFYRLDENGERVFLTDEEVAKKRNTLEKAISKNCST